MEPRNLLNHICEIFNENILFQYVCAKGAQFGFLVHRLLVIY